MRARTELNVAGEDDALIRRLLRVTAVLLLPLATGHFTSGWVFLIADDRKNALEVRSLPDHHFVLGTHPAVLLVCDVRELAYYLKHQQKRADHVDCWWQVANWHEAARRWPWWKPKQRC